MSFLFRFGSAGLCMRASTSFKVLQRTAWRAAPGHVAMELTWGRSRDLRNPHAYPRCAHQNAHAHGRRPPKAQDCPMTLDHDGMTHQ
jgi:hypothetical protein